MARRILSADSALAPQSQVSLGTAAPMEIRGGFMQELQARWQDMRSLGLDRVLFDWQERSGLMREISWVNQARERLDEAFLKVAPSMLRIVLTVKQNLPDPAEQRAFLAEHLDWDLKRVSELCITADSYGLLDPGPRKPGEEEIRQYGWSNALKLAYVRDARTRREIWDAARNGAPRASYRALLEELRRFRERKLIGPPPPARELGERLSAAKEGFDALQSLANRLGRADGMADALATVTRVQRDLNQFRKALQERLKAREVEDMAAHT